MAIGPATFQAYVSDRAAQVDLSGDHMGVQPVFPRTLLMERTKQPALGNVEGRSLNGSAGYRGVTRAVVLRPGNGDGQLARAHLQILVALDVAHIQVTRGQAHPQVRTARNLDGGVEVAVGRVLHVDVGMRLRNLDLHLHFFQALFGTGAAGNHDVVRIGRPDAVAAGLQVQPHRASGDKLLLRGCLATIGLSIDSPRRNRQRHNQQDGWDRKLFHTAGLLWDLYGAEKEKVPAFGGAVLRSEFSGYDRRNLLHAFIPAHNICLAAGKDPWHNVRFNALPSRSFCSFSFSQRASALSLRIRLWQSHKKNRPQPGSSRLALFKE